MILLRKRRGFRAANYVMTSRYSRLGSRADTGHGQTDVDGGTNTTEEELSLQEDLTVGDRNDLKGEG